MRTKRIAPLAIALALGTASAQPAGHPTAGSTVLTFVNRLIINPPQVIVLGYFPTIQGLPGSLFSGTPGEATAYFTWTLDAAGAAVIPNGDPNGPGGLSTAVLPSGETMNVYFNASPNQNWNVPASFSAGQLVATFKSTTGTQTGVLPVALVTQSYILDSSHDFTFKGQTYNLARLLPNGFTSIALGGGVPLANATPAPPALVFTAAGSGLAIGGRLSSLPFGRQ